MCSRVSKYNYVIKIYYNRTSCILKKYICYPNRIASILKILKVTYPDSDIIIYDKVGDRYTIDDWLGHSE